MKRKLPGRAARARHAGALLREKRIMKKPSPRRRWICRLVGHRWRRMTWKQAYPAASGRHCTRCDTTRLGWL